MKLFPMILLSVAEGMNYGKTVEKMCLDGVNYIFSESFGSGSGKNFLFPLLHLFVNNVFFKVKPVDNGIGWEFQWRYSFLNMCDQRIIDAIELQFPNHKFIFGSKNKNSCIPVIDDIKDQSCKQSKKLVPTTKPPRFEG